MSLRSGRSSRASGSCSNAFQGPYKNQEISYFVAYCIFFFVPLFTLIATARIRKRHPGSRRLIGPVYIISLASILLADGLYAITTLLRECDTMPSLFDTYKILIPTTIFTYLAKFLLLVVVLFSLNKVLRQHLGHSPSYFKFVCGFILLLVGGLAAGVVGVQCWNYGVYASRNFYNHFVFAEPPIRLTFYVLYLVAVIVASAMATTTIVSMRSRGLSGHNLVGWVAALMFSMLFWSTLNVAAAAAYFTYVNFSDETSQAFYWLECIFQAFAWICLLFIAKSDALGASMRAAVPQNSAYDPVPVPQYQELPYTVHNGAPPSHQQQSEFIGVSSPMHGNGHMSQAR